MKHGAEADKFGAEWVGVVDDRLSLLTIVVLSIGEDGM